MNNAGTNYKQPPVDARCLDCGYRLFTNESGVCPECGRLFDSHDPTTFRVGDQPGAWRAWARPPTMFECIAIFIFGVLMIWGSSSPPEHSSVLFSLSMICGGVIWVPIVIVFFCRVAAVWADRRRADQSAMTCDRRRVGRWLVVPIFLLVIISQLLYPWALVLRFSLSRDAFEQAAKDVRAGLFQTPRRVGLYSVRSVQTNGSSIDFVTGDSLIDPAGFQHTPNGPWIPHRTHRIGMSVARDWNTVEH